MSKVEHGLPRMPRNFSRNESHHVARPGIVRTAEHGTRRERQFTETAVAGRELAGQFGRELVRQRRVLLHKFAEHRVGNLPDGGIGHGND